LGGLIWGILGDKKGRLSVLFGSIIIYSLANICNSFVDNLTTYKICRFFAGIGLAGELGAGISLVMETAKKRNNYGPQIITGFGLLGAVLAGLIGDYLSGELVILLVV
jgi:putative MFS transporter